MSAVELLDLAPAIDDVRSKALAGLTAPRKTLPCQLLYDERGSELFEAICEQPEYYPTRTELAIMRQDVDAMAARLGRECAVIEFGSGAGIKSRMLLEALAEPAAYVPVEISREILLDSCDALRQAFADVPILPVCADYTQSLTLPDLPRPARRFVAYFPGSTIGNFQPDQAERFLRRTAQLVGSHGGLLIGVDLIKDQSRLEAAYDDAAGVTAAFNLNVLHRINRELGASIDVGRFEHQAVFNPDHSRMEMHLRSTVAQTVEIADVAIDFEAGETIHTECSYKYALSDFAALADRAGFTVEQVWLDEQQLFSVQWLTC